MENKLFTTVAIEDKHVGEFKIGFTSSGEMVFGKLYLDNTRLKWYLEDDNYQDFHGIYPYVTHVLDEVTLPTQEEILSTSTGWREETKQECYLEGVEYILNKLR